MGVPTASPTRTHPDPGRRRAAAAVSAALAQETGRTYRLGFLTVTARDTLHVAGVFDELRLAGFIEGQNLAVVAGSFGLNYEQFPKQAAAFAKAAPDAIYAGADHGIRAAQAVTRTIPIVGITEDMVSAGLVQSLARPGGNTTGVSMVGPELNGKRLEILIEAVPGARRMAVLADPSITAPQQLRELQEAARRRGVELAIYTVRTHAEIVPAIDAAKAAGVAALNVLGTPLGTSRHLVIERAAALKLPAIYQFPEVVDDGGLAGYGPSRTEVFRQMARMLVKVLRGAKPADLPVEQPTRFELVINLRTARAIGLEIPATLVLRADKVIE